MKKMLHIQALNRIWEQTPYKRCSLGFVCVCVWSAYLIILTSRKLDSSQVFVSWPLGWCWCELCLLICPNVELPTSFNLYFAKTNIVRAPSLTSRFASIVYRSEVPEHILARAFVPFLIHMHWYAYCILHILYAVDRSRTPRFDEA